MQYADGRILFYDTLSFVKKLPGTNRIKPSILIEILAIMLDEANTLINKGYTYKERINLRKHLTAH